MIEMKGVVPLNLVKQEMDNTIQNAELQLKAVMEAPDNLAPLNDFAGLLKQVLGAAKMIDLTGVILLIENVLVLVNQIQAHNDKFADIETGLATLGHTLLTLTHYLEYVHRSQHILSVLLLPAINEVRRVTGEPLLTEWAFVGRSRQYSPLVQFKPKQLSEQLSVSEIQAKCGRLRHMYQVGLLGVLLDESRKTNLKLMIRSIERLSQYCGKYPIGQVWWIAQGVLEAFSAGDVDLYSGRKVLLRKFDEVMRRLLSATEEVLEQTIDSVLLQESLHIVALSHDVSPIIEDIKSAFSIKPSAQSFLDSQLRQERDRMNGPAGSIISQVVVNLRDELIAIKDTIEVLSRGMTLDSDSLSQMQGKINRVSSTLVMLSLPEAGKQLEHVGEVIARWSVSGHQDEESALHQMADILLNVESELAKLSQEYQKAVIPEQVVEADQRVPLNLLQEARLMVVGESRVGLSMSKKAIASYIESDYRIEHIENVPSTLHAVSGALEFLELNRASGVVQNCLQFVKQRMLDSTQGGIPHNTFETMADAMSSVDYYLESMEDMRPIGDGLLDLAEESISELGLTV